MGKSEVARVAVQTGCPATESGEHFILWVDRPAQYFNGKQVSGPEGRGECDFCGARFVHYKT